MDIDTSKYSLYVSISDSSYIDKLKNSFNLIKSYPEVSIGFLKEKVIKDEDEDEEETEEDKEQNAIEQNIIELNTTGSIESSIYIYIKHILAADDRNFKTYNPITKMQENIINVKVDSINDIFKSIQSTSTLTMYMLNTPDKLYINEQEENTISNDVIQTMEKKDNLQIAKYCNLNEETIKAKVCIDSELLSDIIKKKFNKSIKSESCIDIKLTENALSFINNPIRQSSFMNSKEINCLQSDRLIIEMYDPKIKIITSKYVYQNLDFLKSIKPQYYKTVIILFAKLKRDPKDDNYMIQFIYSGAKGINGDYIKISIFPCKPDNNDNYDNDNQIDYDN